MRAQNLKGVSTLVGQQEAAVFYAEDAYRALGDLGDTSATVANGSETSSMTVNLGGTSASGRVLRFLHGMLVDLWSSDGATHRNPDFLVAIDDVDPLSNTITLRRLDGGSFQTSTTLNSGVTYAGAGGDNDILVIKDSLSQGPINLNSWIKNSGTLFNDVPLATRSMFKSYIKTGIARPSPRGS